MRIKKWVRGIFVFGAMFFTLCTLSDASELVVFSGRKEPLIKPVLDLYEKTTGVKVVLKTGDSAALGQQIIQEQPNPTADIFIAKESGSLEYLRLKGVFDSYISAATQKIPALFKDPSGTWIGVSGRSRAVIYNTDLINRDDVPQTLNDLTNPKYKGKIAAAKMGNESVVAWVTALRLYLGDEQTSALLRALKDNDIQLISESHTDIRKAVGRGEYPLGLINHYYYHLQAHEADPELRHVGIAYLDQADGARGEIVNVSGAAIVKNAPHLDAAKQFIDFLVSEDAQKLFAEVNFEYPLLPGVPAHQHVQESLQCSKPTILDCLNVMDVNLTELGPEWDVTVKILEDAQWY